MPDPRPAFDLDRIDVKILDILRTDGRITYQRLAERIHLTPRPAQERVRKLERSGAIRGYVTLIDPAALGCMVVVHAQIALASQSGRAAQEAFEAEVRHCPQVLDCYLVSGPFDYLVRLGCRDLEEYRTLTNGWLESDAFRIEKIVSSPGLQTIK